MEQEFEINVPSSVNPSLQLPDASLLWYYRDVEHRLLWLTDEVGDNCYEMVEHIIHWNREDKDIPVEQRKPIRLIIASIGGAVEQDLTLISFIEMSKTPIYGVAIGMVASAAIDIYLACHKKFATKNSYFILHKGSCSNLKGSYNEISAFMENYQKQVEESTQYYIEKTKYSEEEIRKNIENDWYIQLPEALEKGVVDEAMTSLDLLM